MTQIYRVRVALNGWIGGPGLQTFYYRPATTDVTSSTEAAVVAATVRAALDPTKGMYPISWTAQVAADVDVINAVDGVLTGQYNVTPPAVVTGTGAVSNNYGPTAAGMCMTLNTGIISGGSKVRGRSFLVPLCQSFDSNGSPTAEFVATAVGMGNALKTTGAGGPTLVVWRRPRQFRAATTKLKELAARDGGAFDVSGTTVKDKFAILRSRRD